MGCQMLAVLDSPAPAFRPRLDAVPAWFETWEDRLSRFRPRSELCRVNGQAGWQPISAVLTEVLRAAQAAQFQSGGLVTPWLLNALEAAGYDRDFTGLDPSTAPTSGPQAGPPAASAWLDVHHRRVNLPPGARLDLGGVAKGWAADRAASRLGRTAPALVDAGGDVAVSGPRADGSPWPIRVADPLHPGGQLDLLLLWRGGVATSGRDYRRWLKNGTWQHHIIDPRTGRPAQTDVLSATVAASSARAAEMAAKTSFLLGGLAGLQWLDDHPGLAGLLVLEDGTILYSRQWKNHIWR